MKANELMIGDIVSYNCAICRVTSTECFGNLVGIENDTICELVSEEELSSIHLTPEILEKNGFVKGNMEILWHESEFYVTKIKSYYIPFRLEKMHIQYVHQLQHALRLCGLNDLADNFKV